jgi:hypothetical protein
LVNCGILFGAKAEVLRDKGRGLEGHKVMRYIWLFAAYAAFDAFSSITHHS